MLVYCFAFIFPISKHGRDDPTDQIWCNMVLNFKLCLYVEGLVMYIFCCRLPVNGLLLYCSCPLVTACTVTALLPVWLVITDVVVPAVDGSCWPLFSSCFCSWCRKRGGTSRGGYRDKACCWVLAGSRLALLLLLVFMEVPLLELAGWSWLWLVLDGAGTWGKEKNMLMSTAWIYH